MNIFTNITSATRAALLYITVGSVMIVWSTIYYFYLHNHPPQGDASWYWCAGFLLTGCALLLIGLAVGWIGRSARQAEQPHALLNTQDANGNPVANVVPLANNAVIAPGSSTVPAVPINPAMQQPVVVAPPVPPQTSTGS
jgi:hypothetical protein